MTENTLLCLLLMVVPLCLCPFCADGRAARLPL
jgi:hypothetical protein